MDEKIDALVGYIQKECLWQFHSRSWDREENIEGVLQKTGDLLAGREPVLATDADRCFFADAKMLSAEFRSKFPWVGETDPGAMAEILDGVKARMREIAITKSRNEELNVKNY